MKLELNFINDMPLYSRIAGTLQCKLTRGDSTLEQYNATIEFLGFNPVETNGDYTTYELKSNVLVENLKDRFLQFVNSDYGNRYL